MAPGGQVPPLRPEPKSQLGLATASPSPCPSPGHCCRHKGTVTVPIFAASIFRLKSQFRGSLRDILDQEGVVFFLKVSLLRRWAGTKPRWSRGDPPTKSSDSARVDLPVSFLPLRTAVKKTHKSPFLPCFPARLWPPQQCSQVMPAVVPSLSPVLADRATQPSPGPLPTRRSGHLRKWCQELWVSSWCSESFSEEEQPSSGPWGMFCSGQSSGGSS